MLSRSLPQQIVDAERDSRQLYVAKSTLLTAPYARPNQSATFGLIGLGRAVMGEAKESLLYSDPMSSADQARRSQAGGGSSEGDDATQDQEKLIEHILGLLHRVVAAFKQGDQS